MKSLLPEGGGFRCIPIIRERSQRKRRATGPLNGATGSAYPAGRDDVAGVARTGRAVWYWLSRLGWLGWVTSVVASVQATPLP